jgi:hypothetical protein
VNKVQLALLQVANATVHETRRTPGSAAAKIIALDERDAEAAHRRISSNSTPCDAPTDHKNIDCVP